MYRIVLYSLSFLVSVALLFSAFGILKYSNFSTLVLTLGLLSVVAFCTNLLLAKLFKIAPNFESSIITTLILFFVLASPSSSLEWIGIALAAVTAIASKYVVTWRGAHIFNPAAFGVLLVSLIGVGSGAWWIADMTLLYPTLLVGLIVLYKLRRFELFFAFLVPALLLIALKTLPDAGIVDSLTAALTLYPLVFLGAIMLTEPLTMPTSRIDRLIYGVIVGVLVATTFDFGFISASPHLALLIGNIYAFIVTTRTATVLTLVEKKQLTPTTYSFGFKPDRAVKRRAGQYMEFTLPTKKPDSRGNRRTFTIASGPEDDLIRLGIKFYSPGSAFKSQLQSLDVGDTMSATNVAGEFVLPKNSAIPVVFIAGGIGITPYIAMIGSMLASKRKYNAELYYFVSDASEIAFKDILHTAKKAGISVHERFGRERALNHADIQKHPDAEFYLSGSPGLVDAYKKQLKTAGVKKIHVDYFTGY